MAGSSNRYEYCEKRKCGQGRAKVGMGSCLSAAGMDYIRSPRMVTLVTVANCPLENLNRKTFGFGLMCFPVSMFVQINCCIKVDLSLSPFSLCALNIGDTINEQLICT